MEPLLAEAQRRWLRNRELFNVLTNPAQFGLHVSGPVHKPASGTIQLFFKQEKMFRKDGHEWKKKHNSLSVRENYEKLRIDGLEMIYCCYTSAAENPSFHRRIYWLLAPRDVEYVLVHHLDVRNIAQPNHDAHLALMCDATQQHIPSTELCASAAPRWCLPPTQVLSCAWVYAWACVVHASVCLVMCLAVCTVRISVQRVQIFFC